MSTTVTELEDRKRVDELTILNTRIRDLDALKKTADMTGAQVIALADVLDAIQSIIDGFKKVKGLAADVPAAWARPENAETRDAVRDYLRRMYEEKVSASPDAVTLPTVNGPVTFSDIPRDASGRVDQVWLEENCTCDDHEQKRIDRDTRAAAQSGMYP